MTIAVHHATPLKTDVCSLASCYQTFLKPSTESSRNSFEAGIGREESCFLKTDKFKISFLRSHSIQPTLRVKSLTRTVYQKQFKKFSHTNIKLRYIKIAITLDWTAGLRASHINILRVHYQCGLQSKWIVSRSSTYTLQWRCWTEPQLTITNCCVAVATELLCMPQNYGLPHPTPTPISV